MKFIIALLAALLAPLAIAGETAPTQLFTTVVECKMSERVTFRRTFIYSDQAGVSEEGKVFVIYLNIPMGDDGIESSHFIYNPKQGEACEVKKGMGFYLEDADTGD